MFSLVPAPTPARLLIAGFALMIVAAGCGDGSGGADSAVGQALTEKLMEDGDAPFAGEEEASCMSGQIVDGVGEDRLVELGVTADSAPAIDEVDFTEAEVEVVVDAMFDCVDVKAAMAEQFASDFGEEEAKCVAEELDEELLRSLMATGLVGEDPEMSDELFQAFLDIAAECDLPLG